MPHHGPILSATYRGCTVARAIDEIWSSEEGQDIAEYAILLVLILLLIIGTVRLMGGRANTVFSTVADIFQQRTSGD
jgi:Flp pilus assembly pilin Flp